MSKIDRINAQLGYKDIEIKVSKDYTKLKINKDVYDLNKRRDAKVIIEHHNTVKEVVDTEETITF